VTVAPNKASSESNSNNLKKMIFQRQHQLLTLFFSDLTVGKRPLAKGRTGVK